MLTAQELKTSPLFHDISYEEYRRMLTCFQAAQRSYVPEEQVYDFTSSRTDAVGIVERGQVSLIRIDEAGVASLAAIWPLRASRRTAWRWWPAPPATFCSSTIPAYSNAARMPAPTTARWSTI